MEKSLDRKLADIHRDPSGSKAFIIADAKDADMAFGIGAPGRSPEMHAGEVRFRTLAEYRAQIRQIVEQGLVDIMLMSASTNYVLAIKDRIFDASHVTPAARANDTSDVFVVRGGSYVEEPSRPFRSATIDHIQCGRVECDASSRVAGANLGLYSVTFNNRLEEDLRALEEYKRFRLEAERKGFRHFLEVFDPNNPQGLSAEQVPHFINDSIARTLAGVPETGRPIFLKVVYHGPKAMEELVAYDPHLIVGILGGSAGTTYDAFKLIAEAQRYGARVALFGRKINQAECQLAFVQFLRMIVEGVISAEEAVRAYHAVLGKLGIKPHRSLDDDLVLRTGVMSYGGRSSVAVPSGAASSLAVSAGSSSDESSAPNRIGPISSSTTPAGGSCGCGGSNPERCACKKPSESDPAANPTVASAVTSPSSTAPDFARMSNAEKLAYQQARRDRIFGR